MMTSETIEKLDIGKREDNVHVATDGSMILYIVGIDTKSFPWRVRYT